MVHVHGRDVGVRARSSIGVGAERRLLVPVDVGKHEAMTLVADGGGERLVAPFTFMLDQPGLAGFVERLEGVAASRDGCRIEVGVEAAQVPAVTQVGCPHRPGWSQACALGELPVGFCVVASDVGRSGRAPTCP